MPKFRKKPFVIEAVQWTGNNFADVAALSDNIFGPYGDAGQVSWIEIATLEGRMKGLLLDWVIKGVAGEVYPCKPEIFDRSYERSQEADMWLGQMVHYICTESHRCQAAFVSDVGEGKVVMLHVLRPGDQPDDPDQAPVERLRDIAYADPDLVQPGTWHNETDHAGPSV